MLNVKIKRLCKLLHLRRFAETFLFTFVAAASLLHRTTFSSLLYWHVDYCRRPYVTGQYIFGTRQWFSITFSCIIYKTIIMSARARLANYFTYFWKWFHRIELISICLLIASCAKCTTHTKRSEARNHALFSLALIHSFYYHKVRLFILLFIFSNQSTTVALYWPSAIRCFLLLFIVSYHRNWSQSEGKKIVVNFKRIN